MLSFFIVALFFHNNTFVKKPCITVFLALKMVITALKLDISTMQKENHKIRFYPYFMVFLIRVLFECYLSAISVVRSNKAFTVFCSKKAL